MAETVNMRELALETLLAVEKDGRQSHLVMRDVLDKYAWLPQHSRAFYVRLCEGTLEYRLRLDFVLDQFSKTKTNHMKPVILEILRMGVYQLLYMDAVPASAAVNESVRLARRKGFRTLTGFVNGVLRAVDRGRNEIAWPGREDLPRYLEIAYSMPRFLVDRWLASLGPEVTEAMCRAFLRPAPLTARLRDTCAAQSAQAGRDSDGKAGEPQPHSTRAPQAHCAGLAALAAEGVTAVPVPLARDAFVLTGAGNPAHLAAFLRGLFTLQDVSSQAAVLAAGIAPGDTVLDLCAAPGGKSTYAADLTGPRGLVLCGDLTKEKVARIEENAARLHLTNLCARVWDAAAEDFPAAARAALAEHARSTQEQTAGPAGGFADVVLADVPCSGYGVIGRKPDIKYRASAESEASLIPLQRAILANAVRCLKAGGTLLFSTCTINRQENEENAAWLLAHFPLSLEEQRQFLPGQDPCDGFFYARFRKAAKEGSEHDT